MKYLFILLYFFVITANAQSHSKEYYDAVYVRNTAVDAYVLKACHVTQGDVKIYCGALLNRNKEVCSKFKNKYVRENCIEDIKILIGQP